MGARFVKANYHDFPSPKRATKKPITKCRPFKNLAEEIKPVLALL